MRKVTKNRQKTWSWLQLRYIIQYWIYFLIFLTYFITFSLVTEILSCFRLQTKSNIVFYFSQLSFIKSMYQEIFKGIISRKLIMTYMMWKAFKNTKSKSFFLNTMTMWFKIFSLYSKTASNISFLRSEDKKKTYNPWFWRNSCPPPNKGLAKTIQLEVMTCPKLAR